MSNSKSMVYVFCGNGKGKTSAALGVTIRMLLNNKNVVWISWFKTEKWQISEQKLANIFGTLKMYFLGKGFYIAKGEEKLVEKKKIKLAKVNKAIVFDENSKDDHIRAAQEAVIFAKGILKREKPDLLVLDEIIKAQNEGLIKEEELLEIIKLKRETHIVMTGHVCPERLKTKANLITEMKKIKHPYDMGILAIKGLDY